jgi:alpha-methylacyl-CoA racemase
MSLSVDQYLAEGEIAGSRQVLLTGRYAFYDLYPTKDGGWMSVGAIEPHFYRNLCQRLGLPQYEDKQYAEDLQDEIRAAFRKAFLTRTRDEWTAELAPNDTCVAPVLSIPEVTSEAHWRARGLFMQAEHETRGVFEQLTPVLAGAVRAHPKHAVRSGDDTDSAALLAAVGLSQERIAKLLAEGAVE